MSRYIDADLVRKFLQSKMESYSSKSVDPSKYPISHIDLMAFLAREYQTLVIQFDSLQRERPEVDLEEEIATWIPSHITGGEEGVWKECREAVTKWAGIVAHHFYELGLKARKEE